ncbi:N-acetylneuraminate synthase family protein [Peribacillus simplex]|uniref:N,N'-diacetyllegionaminic acid synthase n=1 Tax=Peribacillus simplex TaxID=1478 RepID=A0A9W4L0B2_9BACI|nr:N-acetylneuraminate synthase family protein [Peribacillus simplex]WHX89197.1 N-acetylneuraminate synthase family protein [Peribacillus simplex]CAH0260017.1 N,N'-diacetyllegionaminic acid synthase [Peribacillus simplex]
MRLELNHLNIDRDGRTFIIAEIGVNHNGSLILAKKMVDKAIDAGADAVKFQMFDTEALTTEQADLTEYQKRTKEKNQYDMLKKLELSPAEFIDLKKYCDKKNTIFLATPFDLNSVDFLNKLDMCAFKVGSGDLTNFPLLKRIVKTGKPIILSTGMSTISEIDQTIEYLNALKGNLQISVLHCTSSYPASEQQINLNVIRDYLKRYPFVIGYSDHSIGIHIPIAATALGARIIEKHITLDQSLPGPDHSASINIEEFKEMVQLVRLTELSLGSEKKSVTEDEERVKPLVRRSLYLKSNTPTGTVITENQLITLRPLAGIEANEFENVIGRVLKVPKKKHAPLFWTDFYD